MAKVKYYAKENSSIGTHSFYAVPIPQKAITAKFNDLEVRTDSMMKLLEKVMSHAQKNINNIEELSVLIKEE